MSIVELQDINHTFQVICSQYWSYSLTYCCRLLL